jgi:hypothetical protein
MFLFFQPFQSITSNSIHCRQCSCTKLNESERINSIVLLALQLPIEFNNDTFPPGLEKTEAQKFCSLYSIVGFNYCIIISDSTYSVYRNQIDSFMLLQHSWVVCVL